MNHSKEEIRNEEWFKSLERFWRETLHARVTQHNEWGFKIVPVAILPFGNTHISAKYILPVQLSQSAKQTLSQPMCLVPPRVEFPADVPDQTIPASGLHDAICIERPIGWIDYQGNPEAWVNIPQLFKIRLLEFQNAEKQILYLGQDMGVYVLPLFAGTTVVYVLVINSRFTPYEQKPGAERGKIERFEDELNQYLGTDFRPIFHGFAEKISNIESISISDATNDLLRSFQKRPFYTWLHVPGHDLTKSKDRKAAYDTFTGEIHKSSQNANYLRDVEGLIGQVPDSGARDSLGNVVGWLRSQKERGLSASGSQAIFRQVILGSYVVVEELLYKEFANDGQAISKFDPSVREEKLRHNIDVKWPRKHFPFLNWTAHGLRQLRNIVAHDSSEIFDEADSIFGILLAVKVLKKNPGSPFAENIIAGSLSTEFGKPPPALGQIHREIIAYFRKIACAYPDVFSNFNAFADPQKYPVTFGERKKAYAARLKSALDLIYSPNHLSADFDIQLFTAFHQRLKYIVGENEFAAALSVKERDGGFPKVCEAFFDEDSKTWFIPLLEADPYPLDVRIVSPPSGKSRYTRALWFTDPANYSIWCHVVPFGDHDPNDLRKELSMPLSIFGDAVLKTKDVS